MRRRSRALSPEDRALWQAYTGGIQRIDPVQGDAPSASIPATKLPTPGRTNGSHLPLPPARAAPRVNVTLAPDPMIEARTAPPQMDAKAYGRLKRGKLRPEARIDLHGMTAERAHGALRGFILDAHARGHRLVLVITGKGRDIDPHMGPARRGVLRNAVPQWLALPPLAGLVLQITPAHDRHGGAGAYYVYLKRRR
ncbi:MAG: Smr/MutS family protein [Pseudomonadota bacterium]